VRDAVDDGEPTRGRVLLVEAEQREDAVDVD
jgi:hypothetical protein